MSTEIQRCVRIKRVVDGFGELHDAIYLTEAEYQSTTAEQIEKMVEQRVANWIGAIETARSQPKPAEEEVQAARTSELIELFTSDDPAASGVLAKFLAVTAGFEMPLTPDALRAEMRRPKAVDLAASAAPSVIPTPTVVPIKPEMPPQVTGRA